MGLLLARGLLADVNLDLGTSAGGALPRSFSFVLIVAVLLIADLGRRKGGTSGILNHLLGICRLRHFARP